MTPLTRRSAALVLVALACVLPFGGAQAATGDDNFATALNRRTTAACSTSPGTSAAAGRRPGPPPQLGRGPARCTGCEATAIAFQIVLVSGSPRTVVPQKHGRGGQHRVHGVHGDAVARQFVRVDPDPVRFTGTGRSILADVREDLEALEGQDLPLDRCTWRWRPRRRRREVLRNELVLKSNPSGGRRARSAGRSRHADLD